MRFLVFVPVVFSILVLAAHFLRGGQTLAVAGVLALLALLFVRRRWAARIVQVALVLGAAEWIRTLIALATWRSEHGQPYARMVLILGVVAAISLGAALLFSRPTLRGVYGAEHRPSR